MLLLLVVPLPLCANSGIWASVSPGCGANSWWKEVLKSSGQGLGHKSSAPGEGRREAKGGEEEEVGRKGPTLHNFLT